MPVELWESKSHSTTPAVSGLGKPTCTTVTGTCGRFCLDSAYRRSVTTCATSPSAMTATAVPDASGVYDTS